MEKDLSGKRLIAPVARLHWKTVSRPSVVLQTHKLYLPLVLIPVVVATGQLIISGLEYSYTRLLLALDTRDIHQDLSLSKYFLKGGPAP